MDGAFQEYLWTVDGPVVCVDRLHVVVLEWETIEEKPEWKIHLYYTHAQNTHIGSLSHTHSLTQTNIHTD